jgi:hypothetical protein
MPLFESGIFFAQSSYTQDWRFNIKTGKVLSSRQRAPQQAIDSLQTE